MFALTFSVALYFSFVTLQYDPALDATKGSIKGEAGIKAGSVILILIVTVFLLYANRLFMKRRSKEIGLLQLIGMTKNNVFRILSAENFILYFSSFAMGMFLGFSVSKVILMILFKITGVETTVNLRFSSEAFIQTTIVFTIIYLLMMGLNYLFIQRRTILNLFHVNTTSETKGKRLTWLEMLIGLLGIGLILLGYYLSTELFSAEYMTSNGLFFMMILILSSVIVGTYLFYKGTVSFVFHLIRKRKQGLLSIQDVTSLSPLMFRMKSNSLLLTIITTISALAIGLLSLSYITFYSIEEVAKNTVPNDFAFISEEDANQLKQALDSSNITYEETIFEVIQVAFNMNDILSQDNIFANNDGYVRTPVISDTDLERMDVDEGELIISGYNKSLQSVFPFKSSGIVTLKGKNNTVELGYTGIEKNYYLSHYYTGGSARPTAIVDDKMFQQLKKDLDREIEQPSSIYIGLDVVNKKQLEQAHALFAEQNFTSEYAESQLHIKKENQKIFGLIMFVVGFLGLTFLITSGCILYFKQMDEAEDEQPNYTILRKIGFTQSNLLKGVIRKQIFNFGIPLLVGLSHSYFAVKSGWFFFGAELWTPMMLVMVIYTALYSIFAFLSVLYYKRVIREAL